MKLTPQQKKVQVMYLNNLLSAEEIMNKYPEQYKSYLEDSITHKIHLYQKYYVNYRQYGQYAGGTIFGLAMYYHFRKYNKFRMISLFQNPSNWLVMIGSIAFMSYFGSQLGKRSVEDYILGQDQCKKLQKDCVEAKIRLQGFKEMFSSYKTGEIQKQWKKGLYM